MSVELVVGVVINESRVVIMRSDRYVTVYMCWEAVMLMEIKCIAKFNDIGMGVFIRVNVKVKVASKNCSKEKYRELYMLFS